MIKYYKNEIYPIGLVLTNNFSELQDEYTSYDDDEIVEHKSAQATTYMLTRKTTDYYAMAVGIVFNSAITPKLAAHEGFHAAYDMMVIGLHIPLTDYSDEAWAYLIGWIAECIDDFKNIITLPILG